jgi:hypothetical protein
LNGDNVFALAVSGGTVYACGEFTSMGGLPRKMIAAIDATTGVATGWNPGANGFHVDALAVSGGRVYTGGFFNAIGGQSQASFAALDEDHTLSVGGDPNSVEGSLPIAPNPTRARMQVQYAVARTGRVRVDLLDVSGRVVATLADRTFEPGRHVATWDGVGRRGRLSPGLHFVRVVTPDGVMVRKLAIIQ